MPGRCSTVAPVIRAFRLALALLTLTASAGGAFAHAVVLETRPADGALLQTAPQSVLVIFNEPISPVRAQVVDAEGTDITPLGATTLEGAEMRIALPSDLTPGSYIASYRVVSSDSHPIAGSVVFSIGQVSSSVAASATPADDTGWRIAMATARALVFAGLLGGAGGVLFLGLVLPASVRSEERLRKTVTAIAAAGCAAAALAMGIQGGLLLNGPAASIFAFETWRTGVTSYYGRTASAALIGLALAVVGLRTGPGIRPLAWIGVAIALGGFGLSGHVVSSGPRWLTIPTLITHTAAAAFWAGSLLPLRQLLTQGDKAAAKVVERFSRLALVAVGLLFLAGLVIAALQVRSFGALLTTGYGIALTIKLALVTGLIALAAWNKFRLTPPLLRGKAAARVALQRTILAELALVGAILLATGFIGTRPPPRVLLAGAAHAVHLAGSEEGLALTVIQERRTADIALASAWSGMNRIEFVLRSADGTPLEAQEVLLVASNIGEGVEPLRRAAELGEDGIWRVENLLLAPAGRWTLRLDVLISDFEMATIEARTDILNRPLAGDMPDAGGAAVAP